MTRTFRTLHIPASLFQKLYKKAFQCAIKYEDKSHRLELYACIRYSIPVCQRVANLMLWYEKRQLHHLMATIYRSWIYDDNKIMSCYPHIVGYSFERDETVTGW